MAIRAGEQAQVRVGGLHVYPFKSAQGLARECVRLMPTGLERDRHWMAVDPRGKFLSQRTHPLLARIATSLDEDALHLSAPGLPTLRLELVQAGEMLEVQVWDDRCRGIDQGRAAADWISSLLGEPASLVRVPEDPRRLANAAYAGLNAPPLTFADGFQLLVCNSASLADLNARMPQPLPMERFRPNIVLDGLPAFAEDRIETLNIGAVVLRLVKPCARCVITSTDQLTGERSTNPLPVLRTFRFDRVLKGVTFGENAIPVAGIGAQICIGDPCALTYKDAGRNCAPA